MSGPPLSWVDRHSENFFFFPAADWLVGDFRCYVTEKGKEWRHKAPESLLVTSEMWFRWEAEPVLEGCWWASSWTLAGSSSRLCVSWIACYGEMTGRGRHFIKWRVEGAILYLFYTVYAVGVPEHVWLFFSSFKTLHCICLFSEVSSPDWHEGDCSLCLFVLSVDQCLLLICFFFIFVARLVFFGIVLDCTRSLPPTHPFPSTFHQSHRLPPPLSHYNGFLVQLAGEKVTQFMFCPLWFVIV